MIDSIVRFLVSFVYAATVFAMIAGVAWLVRLFVADPSLSFLETFLLSALFTLFMDEMDRKMKGGEA